MQRKRIRSATCCGMVFGALVFGDILLSEHPIFSTTLSAAPLWNESILTSSPPSAPQFTRGASAADQVKTTQSSGLRATPISVGAASSNGRPSVSSSGGSRLILGDPSGAISPSNLPLAAPQIQRVAPAPHPQSDSTQNAPLLFGEEDDIASPLSLPIPSHREPAGAYTLMPPSDASQEERDRDFILAPPRRALPGSLASGPIVSPIDIDDELSENEAGSNQFLAASPFETSNLSESGPEITDQPATEVDLLDSDPGLPEVDPQYVEEVLSEDDLVEQSDEGTAPASDAGIESSHADSGQTYEESEAPRRPRPVRIPSTIVELSGGTDSAHGTNSEPVVAPSASANELAKERSQEAPHISAEDARSGREDQGVDAARAAKPAKTYENGAGDATATNSPRSLPPVVPVHEQGSKSSERTNKAGINAADAARLQRTADCLDFYLNTPESTSTRSPWAVMHALIAFGADYELQHGNSRVNAIGWMCHNGTCRTQRMFTPKGRSFVPNVGAGVQGHDGQFLAILAQANVPLDYPIQIGTQRFKVEDLVRYEMATCKEKSELTFKLIGLSYYLDSNKQWRANDGRVWSIPKLIQEELAQPVVGAACGGTHRLMGFSFSVRQRALQGQPINGQFARAQQFVNNYIDYTWRLQNPDGSFSTSWYEGRGNEPNDERKVQTTGHMLEWLMYTLPDSEINQPRVQASIDYLLSQIYDNREHKWPIGPRGHATRAVALYQARYLEIEQSRPDLLKARPQTAVDRRPLQRR